MEILPTGQGSRGFLRLTILTFLVHAPLMTLFKVKWLLLSLSSTYYFILFYYYYFFYRTLQEEHSPNFVNLNICDHFYFDNFFSKFTCYFNKNLVYQYSRSIIKLNLPNSQIFKIILANFII